MAEALTLFTVPSKWGLHSSVREGTNLQKVVGVLTPDEREIWLPDSPNDYWHSGGYSGGYSRKEAEAKRISIQDALAEKLVSFFEGQLLEMRWRDVGRTAERYDCHWFGFWMKGLLDRGNTTDDSYQMAKSVISNGTPVETVPPGEIGVVGVSFGRAAYPEHTYIGLDETSCIQVNGMHDAVTIAPQAETIQHYTEISEIGPYLAGAKITPHILAGNPAELKTASLMTASE